MPSSVLTGKGQTTIPREVRNALGLKPGDRIVYLVEDDAVRMKTARRTIDELHGCFPVRGRGKRMTAQSMRNAFERGIALDVVRKMK